MAEQRQIVLIPAWDDLAPEKREYFDNFVWHIRQLLETHKINAHMMVAEAAKK